MCAELCLFSRSLKMQAAVQSAPRDKSLIFRPSADNSSRRRLRLLSCPNPVECLGSRALTDMRARTFDILRSTGGINHYDVSAGNLVMNRLLARRRVVAKRVHRKLELVQLKCAQTIRRSDGPEVVEPLRSCWKQPGARALP